MALRILFVFGAFFYAGAVCAAPVLCPAQYLAPVAAIANIGDTPPGWVAHFHGNLPLIGASVIFGAPENQGEVIPENRSRMNGLVEEVYSNLDADVTREKWISCAYGDLNYASSHVTLARRLPAGLKQCVARYKHSASRRANKFLGIECE